MPRGQYDRSRFKKPVVELPSLEDNRLARAGDRNCGRCHWYAMNPDHVLTGLCERYPQAVAKRAEQRCGEWRER